MRKLILLAYSFVNPTLTYSQVKEQTTVTSDEDEEDLETKETSSNTINKFNEIFRHMICDQMLLDGNNKIGGAGKTVEVDESLFGKRKYNRGSCKGRGKWILGGVCRETKDIFMVKCDNNRRDRETLENIITTHVEVGSTVYTDGWKAYKH